MIFLNIFTSVEFYTIAVTVAILIVGFIFNPSRRSPAMTYIYAASVDFSNDIAADGKSIEIESLDDFTLLIRRRGAPLPEGSTAYVNADIVDDKLTLTEKHTINNPTAPLSCYDISVRIDCIKATRYHLRYEVPDSGLWGVDVIVNRDNFTTTTRLQL
ncbi:MAG: hypothetical protein ACI4UN_02405 [Muribaculaceae bacterium]